MRGIGLHLGFGVNLRRSPDHACDFGIPLDPHLVDRDEPAGVVVAGALIADPFDAGEFLLIIDLFLREDGTEIFVRESLEYAVAAEEEIIPLLDIVEEIHISLAALREMRLHCAGDDVLLREVAGLLLS